MTVVALYTTSTRYSAVHWARLPAQVETASTIAAVSSVLHEAVSVWIVASVFVCL